MKKLDQESDLDSDPSAGEAAYEEAIFSAVADRKEMYSAFPLSWKAQCIGYIGHSVCAALAALYEVLSCDLI